jgi:NAD dependent epimerase/dehydratase family enzyme
MNSKKAKQLRRIVKSTQASDETLYKVIRASTLKPQYVVDASCKRGFYRSMKKALKKSGTK